MSDEEKEFTIVTRVVSARIGGRTIVHAYGPYTKPQAKRVQQQMKAEAMRRGYTERSEVSCCRLIDVDRMNREAALREDAHA